MFDNYNLRVFDNNNFFCNYLTSYSYNSVKNRHLLVAIFEITKYSKSLDQRRNLPARKKMVQEKRDKKDKENKRKRKKLMIFPTDAIKCTKSHVRFSKIFRG